MKKYAPHKFRQLLEDKKGSFGIMAAVTSLMLVMSVGVSMELMRIQASKAKLQNLTDNMGLTAAVYIRDNQTPPTSSQQGFAAGTNYTVEDLNAGQSIPNVTGFFTVHYNDELGQAETKFNGKIQTAFLSAFHKPDVDVETKSSIQYPQSAQTAVSVALIVDNSGSMAWDDKPRLNGSRQSGTITRIEGLIQTATTFNQNLEAEILESSSNSQENYLRLGMIPYNSQVVTNRVSDIDWGVLDTGDIDDLDANGGTDSRGPLTLAKTWMNGENDIHEQENGIDDPKRYVVLMSDGANNEEWVCDWQNRNRTRLWRKWNGFKYEYRVQRRRPGSGWVQGIAYNCQVENMSNADSLNLCTQLKNDGVEIFTIGFALEPGIYYADWPNSYATQQIPQTVTDSAYGFLSACASSEEHFITAEDSAELNDAFEKIGEKIVEDTIRIAK